TDFPMRAGLPKKEPGILESWANLYDRLREVSQGRERFILHDGPPYANGNIHIGTSLNKILKDMVVRSHQMLGYDANYVPGWDCHGLPIEWKIEEQYRAKGKNKDEVPINEFRRECREFATHWLGVQSKEFQRLGVIGDFADPYLTMAYAAEAHIARELMKFAMSGQLYRGSKPVMWSVVERTALAEAEVEYQDYQSDTVTVAFAVADVDDSDLEEIGDLAYYDVEREPRARRDRLAPGLNELRRQMDLARNASVLIWTTTPWTIPGNRAVCFSSRVEYGLYEVTGVEPLPDGTLPWAEVGARYIIADRLAAEVLASARANAERVSDVAPPVLATLKLSHPLSAMGYSFPVPTLLGEHVTDEAGTGFVHTAPGHGVEDFEVWMDFKRDLEAMGINPAIPYTVGPDGRFTNEAPGFEGAQVITDAGKKGDANNAVIKALMEAGALVARGRLKHTYPHSWRSKKPVIFRNTPQWFVSMDNDLGDGTTLRTRALSAIDDTQFVPAPDQ
ncbi:MAG: class I tRNA ligase family protein, partial [Pseudomonadota bacterium]